MCSKGATTGGAASQHPNGAKGVPKRSAASVRAEVDALSRLLGFVSEGRFHIYCGSSRVDDR
jgi:hypothetical protein